MAISEARKARLAASVIRQGVPVAVEARAVPKGEMAKAQEAYERAWARLEDSEVRVLESWVVQGPPLVERTESIAVGSEIRERKLKGIDWSEIDVARTEFAREAWSARAFYFALASDRELYKLFWSNRGGCRAEVIDADGVVTDMGAVRDALRALPKKAERTAEDNLFARQCEEALLRAERAHEAPLLAARDKYVRTGKPIVDAYNDVTVCPHCAGTSVLKPAFDAPASIVAEWREAAGRASNGRHFKVEAMRREALHHNEAMIDADGNRIESWSEFRARVMRPFMTGSGTKGPTTKAFVPGQGAAAYSKAVSS